MAKPNYELTPEIADEASQLTTDYIRKQAELEGFTLRFIFQRLRRLARHKIPDRIYDPSDKVYHYSKPLAHAETQLKALELGAKISRYLPVTTNKTEVELPAGLNATLQFVSSSNPHQEVDICADDDS